MPSGSYLYHNRRERKSLIQFRAEYNTASFQGVTPNNLGLDGGYLIGEISFDGSIVTTNNINFFGPTLTQIVRFAGLGSIEDTMSANHFDVKGTSAAHPIAVVAGTNLAGGRIRLTVDGNPFTALNFANKALPRLSAADGTALALPPMPPPLAPLALPPMPPPLALLSGRGAGTPSITPGPAAGVPAAVEMPPVPVAPAPTHSIALPPVTITPVAGQFAASRRPGRRFPKAVRRIARRESAARFRIPGSSIQRPRN